MRHLLSIADLSKAEAISILDTGTELARVSDGAVKKLPTLRGRTIVNLFADFIEDAVFSVNDISPPKPKSNINFSSFPLIVSFKKGFKVLSSSIFIFSLLSRLGIFARLSDTLMTDFL